MLFVRNTTVHVRLIMLFVRNNTVHVRLINAVRQGLLYNSQEIDGRNYCRVLARNSSFCSDFNTNIYWAANYEVMCMNCSPLCSQWQRTQPVDLDPKSVNLTNLRPGRRYAIYVEMDVLPSFVHGNHDSMHGARSTIVYCSTQPQGEYLLLHSTSCRVSIYCSTLPHAG